MDHRRVGSSIRALRLRRDWSQQQLGARAGLSRWTIAKIERGAFDGLRLRAVEQTAEALDAHLTIQLLWRGGDLGRLLSARHSAFQELVLARIGDLPGWTVAPEVSFAVYRERGVIDLLAFHAPTGVVLVVELKTEIVDVPELLGTLDRKRRLAPVIARERGWSASGVAAWLAIADSRTNRRHVASHRGLFKSALPHDPRRVDAWLATPSPPPLAALSFVTDEPGQQHRSRLATPRRAPGPRAGRSGQGVRRE